MTQEYYMILTEAGLETYAQAGSGGASVVYAAVAVGDGNGELVRPTEDWTKLSNEVWRGSPVLIDVDPANPRLVIVELYIPHDIGGFTVREVGLFDPAGTLLAVGNYPDTYKPTVNNGAGVELRGRLMIEHGNAANTVLLVDPSIVMATREYVDNLLSNHTHTLSQIIPGLGKEGQSLMTLGGKGVWAYCGGNGNNGGDDDNDYDGPLEGVDEGDSGAPDLSGMTCRVPDSVPASSRDYVSFDNIVDPQDLDFTLELDPLDSGLVFDSISGFALGQEVFFTAPDTAVDKNTRFSLIVRNSEDKSASATFRIKILGATPPNMQAFSHTIPPTVASQSSLEVSFSGALGDGGHAVSYRVDVGDSGLNFAKFEGIAANEWVELTAPYTALETMPINLTVYAVDSVTGKEAGAEISLAVTGAAPPNLQSFSHTIPASIKAGWETFGAMASSPVYYYPSTKISFSGALGDGGHPVSYRVDPGDSGLSFDKISNIAQCEQVSMTSPRLTISKSVSIMVYVVDSVTGKEAVIGIEITIERNTSWQFRSDTGSSFSFKVPYSGKWRIYVQGGGGAGGGGGSECQILEVNLTAGTTYPITVGKRGKGGIGGTAASPNGADGGNGGSSSFGTLKTVTGGNGGKGGKGATGGAAADVGVHNHSKAPTAGATGSASKGGDGGDGGWPEGAQVTGGSGHGGAGAGAGGNKYGAAGSDRISDSGMGNGSDPLVSATAGSTSAGGRGGDGGFGFVQASFIG